MRQTQNHSFERLYTININNRNSPSDNLNNGSFVYEIPPEKQHHCKEYKLVYSCISILITCSIIMFFAIFEVLKFTSNNTITNNSI